MVFAAITERILCRISDDGLKINQYLPCFKAPRKQTRPEGSEAGLRNAHAGKGIVRFRQAEA